MQIAVVGCGWLGLPLAIELQKSGHNIVATCRSSQKAKALSQLGLSVETFELGDDLSAQRFTQLFGSKVLILNIPVGRKNPQAKLFEEHMQKLLKRAATSQIRNIIFISTTSVYADDCGVVTELSPTQPQTESGRINLAIESLVKHHFAKRSTIIRPAGLVGFDRHPAHYLAGKSGLLNPDNVVNLIHQADVISAIKKVIEKDIWGQTLHLSALQHPTRKDYYTEAAKKLGLVPPHFVEGDGKAKGKQIDPTYSLHKLQLSLAYPSPYQMLKQ